ncbi:MAG: thioredoxin family protein [Rubripirellula sp.]
MNRFMVWLRSGTVCVVCAALALQGHAEMPWMVSTTSPNPAGPTISWHDTLEAGWRESRRRNVPMVIFITSERCHYCDLMKRDTWRDESVSSRLKRDFVAISLSPSRNSETLNRIDVTTYPTTLIGVPQGRIIGHRLGYQPPSAVHGFLSETLVTKR